MVCLTQSRKRGRETESPEELLAQKEREARREAEHKCSSCQFVVEANEQFISKNK